MHEITVLWCFLFFEYCCLNCVFNPFQSNAIGLSGSYHNLAFPTNIKQNLWTLTPLEMYECSSIHLFSEDVLLGTGPVLTTHITKTYNNHIHIITLCHVGVPHMKKSHKGAGVLESYGRSL